MSVCFIQHLSEYWINSGRSHVQVHSCRYQFNVGTSFVSVAFSHIKRVTTDANNSMENLWIKLFESEVLRSTFCAFKCHFLWLLLLLPVVHTLFIDAARWAIITDRQNELSNITDNFLKRKNGNTRKRVAITLCKDNFNARAMFY